MNQQHSAKRIIWAVDALQECGEIEQRCLEAILALGGSDSTEIEPVYVLPPQLITTAFGYPTLATDIQAALESLQRRLSLISRPRISPPKVLDKPIASTAGAVAELSQYAATTRTDLIVIGTHCRKGIGRWFLGSFAESLLLRSRTPLLMVGPETPIGQRIKSILFPTDFGTTATEVFPRVLELAQTLGARLVLYHRTLSRSQPDKSLQGKLEGLQKLAKNVAVESEIMLEVSNASESDAILGAARSKNANLIAMAAHSGALRATVAGSTTRQVVRGSICPVWVLHERGLDQTVFNVTEADVMSDLTEHGA